MISCAAKHSTLITAENISNPYKSYELQQIIQINHLHKGTHINSPVKLTLIPVEQASLNITTITGYRVAGSYCAKLNDLPTAWFFFHLFHLFILIPSTLLWLPLSSICRLHYTFLRCGEIIHFLPLPLFSTMRYKDAGQSDSCITYVTHLSLLENWVGKT